MDFKEKKDDIIQKKTDELARIMKNDKIEVKYTKHFEKKEYTRDLDKRVNQRMKEYEESFETRREKLRDMLWKEEREQIKEVVDQAEKADDWNLQQMKIRLQQLRANREKERLKLLEEKKLQQYILKCDEFRPVLIQRRLVESKKAQIEQIKENECKKESERELDVMWHQMLLREVEAQNERAWQDELDRRKRNFENKAVWDMQLKASELNKENERREKLEEQMSMQKLKEQLIKEELAELEAKHQKRHEYYLSIHAQLKEQKEILARRTDQEREFQRLFDNLIEEELNRERNMVSDKAVTAKREMAQYREYLAQLDNDRRQEEMRLDELVQQAMKEINAKQDEAKCKLEMARKALQDSVNKKLAEQVKCRREEAEQQLKMKEAENQLIQLIIEQNERIRAEHSRQQQIAAKEYRADLKKQMEYTNLLKEREKEELERQLAQGKIEEENYRKITRDLIYGNVTTGIDHPFKKVLKKEACFCSTK